jgi:hypothetical protein
MNIMIGMRRRFGRRRRSGNGGGGGSDDRRGGTVDPRWLDQVAESGIVPVSALARIEADDAPTSLAVIGSGTTAEGERALVAVGRSGGDALLAGLAVATRLAAEEGFAGTLHVVAPAWGVASRRRLGAIGGTPFALDPLPAPFLAEGPAAVEAEPLVGPLFVAPERLARHPIRPADRELCRRALAGLAGLAAKHGGSVRGVGRSVELALLARRVAAIRVDDEGVLLDLFIDSRRSERLQAEGLADALDRLEGSLRKLLNDREVRDGEDGFRARVLQAAAEAGGLRALERWPVGGQDSDALDALGALPDGQPAVLAVRRQLSLPALGPILDATLALGPSLPELLARADAPLRLDAPRLVLAARAMDDAVVRVLATLTLESARFTVQDSGREAVLRSAGESAAAPPSRGREPRGRDLRQPRDLRAPREERPARDERGPRDERAARDARRPREERDLREELRPAAEEMPSALDEAEAAPAGAAEERRAPRAAANVPRFEEVSLFDLAEDEGAAGGDEAARGRRRRRRRGRGRGRVRREGGEAGEGGDGGDGGDDEGRSEGWSDDDRALLSEFGADDIQLGPGTPPREERAPHERGRGRGRGREGRGRDREAERPRAEATPSDDDTDGGDDLLPLSLDAPDFAEEPPEPVYEDEEEGEDEADAEQTRMRRERERRRRARLAKAEPAPEVAAPPRPPKPRRAAILAHADRDSIAAAVLLARDLRLLEGLWIYPQADLMTFFRGVVPDLREETPIYVMGFTASPARETIQTAALYRDRLVWFDHHPWPPEDVGALRAAIGAEAVHVAPHTRSSVPLVLGTLTRRSRFSDKLVDLVTGRFTQHDFERWGRVWWSRLGEMASRRGERRGDVESLLVGRPSDLAREAAAVTAPGLPAEVAHVAEHDFRLVHFGGHTLVVAPAPVGLDAALCARIARERYAAALSLAWWVGDETLVLAADDQPGRRSLDVLGMTEHLAEKHAWIEPLPDADHVARFRVRDFTSRPERLEEVLAEIAMGRSILEG